MQLQMPDPVRRYFDAENRKDADGVAACFAEDGRAHDEGRDIVGPAAIRDWIQNASFKYDVTAEPLECHNEGGETIVVARIAGTFPGSPVELAHRFRLVGDRIAALEIG